MKDHRIIVLLSLALTFITLTIACRRSFSVEPFRGGNTTKFPETQQKSRPPKPVQDGTASKAPADTTSKSTPKSDTLPDGSGITAFDASLLNAPYYVIPGRLIAQTIVEEKMVIKLPADADETPIIESRLSIMKEMGYPMMVVQYVPGEETDDELRVSYSKTPRYENVPGLFTHMPNPWKGTNNRFRVKKMAELALSKVSQVERAEISQFFSRGVIRISGEIFGVLTWQTIMEYADVAAARKAIDQTLLSKDDTKLAVYKEKETGPISVLYYDNARYVPDDTVITFIRRQN